MWGLSENRHYRLSLSQRKKRVKTRKNKIELDLNNFNAMQMVDRGYKGKLRDMEIKDGKGNRVGKVLGS
jgi:hypothetical protein